MLWDKAFLAFLVFKFLHSIWDPVHSLTRSTRLECYWQNHFLTRSFFPSSFEFFLCIFWSSRNATQNVPSSEGAVTGLALRCLSGDRGGGGIILTEYGDASTYLQAVTHECSLSSRRLAYLSPAVSPTLSGRMQQIERQQMLLHAHLFLLTSHLH